MNAHMDGNLQTLDTLFDHEDAVTLTGVPDGYRALVLARMASIATGGGARGLVHIAADGQQLAGLVSALEFFSPWLEILELPSWDCLPYDRVSPSAEIIARRIHALGFLANKAHRSEKPLLVLTTANALIQKNAPAEVMAGQAWHLAPGNRIDMDALARWLSENGFERTATVRERGEFAVRGGIVDLYAPGDEDPVRLDFFGDTLDSIRAFDTASQRTTGQLKSISLAPMSEVVLDEKSISRFRRAYIENFGAATRDDALYEAVSEGRRFAGSEHWLPLFYERLDTVFDYLDGFRFAVDHHVEDAVARRHEQIVDHYEARRQAVSETQGKAADGATPYKPVEPGSLYLGEEEVHDRLKAVGAATLSPFQPVESQGLKVIDLQGRPGRSFAAERASGTNVFEAVVQHAIAERGEGQKIAIAAWSAGSRDRLKQVLAEHGMERLEAIGEFAALENMDPRQTALAVLPIEEGFRIPGLTVICEQDILGDRLVRRSARKRKAADFIAEASALAEGDIVVHAEHGIGRFVGLKTIEAAGAPHDCLELRYAGDDKLYLPVENIELLSRYGSACFWASSLMKSALRSVMAWATRLRVPLIFSPIIFISSSLKGCFYVCMVHRWTRIGLEL